MDYDLDGAVQAKFNDLVGRMRAKRLAQEFPVPEEKATEEETEDPEDQTALESMLDSE